MTILNDLASSLGQRNENANRAVADRVQADLSLLDEIAAVDGLPLQAGELTPRIGQFAPGTKVTLSIVRHGVTTPVDVTLGADPAYGWALSVSPGATRVQLQRLAAWLAAGP